MHSTLNTSVDEQLKRISNPQPEVLLVAPCKLNEGIISVSAEESAELRNRFTKSSETKAFFIPASGSGSRMFQFLFNFLSNPSEENRGQVERFSNHLQDFAFFHQFPAEVQKKLADQTMDIDAFVAYILNDNGMGLAHLPKGLIAFHKHGPFILNPFHEHILQGLEICSNNCSFHFTIREAFRPLIEKRLEHMEGMTGKRLNIDFSVQNPDTDAVAFDEENNIVKADNGEVLHRPAGHGALLENLSAVDADLIFIKNIDNVQHLNHSTEAIQTQQMLGGLLLGANEAIRRFMESPDEQGLKALNAKYQFFHEEEMKRPFGELKELLNRPLRVCGMVRNEGQPGGGPFWITDKDGVSKQIVEKAQISAKPEQFRLMIQSTHFNPVMLVCSGKLPLGGKVDFEEFRDEEKYFVVHKNHHGHDIRFTELPGLWNGSMAHWNSVFVEIPSSTFSPVKTVLDLLEPAHLP